MNILFLLILQVLQLEACKPQKQMTDASEVGNKDQSSILPAQGIVIDDDNNVNNTKKQPTILSESVSAFNSKIFEIISQLENGNIMYSPLSLHLGLFQTYLGTPRNSSTRVELESLLELNLEEEDVGYLNNYEFVLTTHTLRYTNTKVHKHALTISFFLSPSRMNEHRITHSPLLDTKK